VDSRLEWPYALNSRTGRALFKHRYKERLTELKPLLWIELIAWGMLGFAFSSWRAVVIGYLAAVPVLCALALYGVYRRMKSEQYDILLHLEASEDQS